MKLKQYFRRSLAVLISVMTLAAMLITVPALANEKDVEEKSAELIAAETLRELDLFLGYGDDADGNPVFGLEDGATRLHGIIMLLRYLGKYEEAMEGNNDCPFTDVSGDYNRAIVGYAFAMGYTKGVSGERFDPAGALTAPMYLTFVLRALEYEDNVDFKWNTACELTDKLGITNGEYYKDSGSVRRGRMVLISLFALGQQKKTSEQTLIEALNDAGAFSGLELTLGEITALAGETVKSLSQYTLKRNTTYYAELVGWRVKVTASSTADTNAGEFVWLNLETNNPDDPDDKNSKLWGLEYVIRQILSPFADNKGYSALKSIVFTTSDTTRFQTDIPVIKIIDDVIIKDGLAWINMILDKEDVKVTVNSGARIKINNVTVFNNSKWGWFGDEHGPMGTGVPIGITYKKGMVITDGLGFKASAQDSMTYELSSDHKSISIDKEDAGILIDVSQLTGDLEMLVRARGFAIRFDAGEGLVAEPATSGAITVNNKGSGRIFTIRELNEVSAETWKFAPSAPPDRFFKLSIPEGVSYSSLKLTVVDELTAKNDEK